MGGVDPDRAVSAVSDYDGTDAIHRKVDQSAGFPDAEAFGTCGAGDIVELAFANHHYCFGDRGGAGIGGIGNFVDCCKPLFDLCLVRIKQAANGLSGDEKLVRWTLPRQAEAWIAICIAAVCVCDVSRGAGALACLVYAGGGIRLCLRKERIAAPGDFYAFDLQRFGHNRIDVELMRRCLCMQNEGGGKGYPDLERAKKQSTV